MDKYQDFLLGSYSKQYFIFYRCCPLANEIEGTATQYGEFDKEADTFTITQDEDINIVDYVLIIGTDSLKTIEHISILKSGKWEVLELSPYGANKVLLYKIIINFNNRIEKIKFSFKNNLADDYILNLKYIEADKDKYYAKRARQKKDSLLNAANIKHSTGNDLVNIYFQPCCEDYERTEITLFKDNQMLAKYKIDDGVFFKSIGGLAYGTYEYIVKQFGKDDILLLETTKNQFSISRPNYGGQHLVGSNVNGNW